MLRVERGWWPVIAPGCRLEKYTHRDRKANPRIEVKKEFETSATMQAVRARCAECMTTYHPMKVRKGRRGAYIVTSCSGVCQRKDRCRDEYSALAEFIRSGEYPPLADQPSLL